MDDTMDYSVATESIHTSGTPNMYVNTGLHTADKGFRQVKRKRDRGFMNLEYYVTPYIPESRIRNAVTGIRYRDDNPKYKYVVGSKQEDLFFKVRISTGETGQEPVLLFYDSPEQCEKHQKVVFNTDIKENWHNKNQRYQIWLSRQKQ